MKTRRLRFLLIIALVPLAVLGCPNVENPPPPANDQEVITTVALTFTPDGGGDAVEFAHADPENDGDPVIDTVTLTIGTTYTLGVQFLNELEDPPEDITVEVDEESAEHQVFIYGSGVEGPATGTNAAHLVVHAYDDTDENGFPVGLANTIDPVTAGDAELKVMLRHLPPENDTAVKVEGLAEDFAAGGSAAIPGEVDADVTFPLTVE